MYALMVIEVDAGTDFAMQRCVTLESLVMIHLGLEALVPRFDVRVVIHVAWSVRTLHDGTASQRPGMPLQEIPPRFPGHCER
jgi:hypothetical protein